MAIIFFKKWEQSMKIAKTVKQFQHGTFFMALVELFMNSAQNQTAVLKGRAMPSQGGLSDAKVNKILILLIPKYCQANISVKKLSNFPNF